MFCENCGNKLPDNAKFCGKCGAEIPEILHIDYTPKKHRGISGWMIALALAVLGVGSFFAWHFGIFGSQKLHTRRLAAACYFDNDGTEYADIQYTYADDGNLISIWYTNYEDDEFQSIEYEYEDGRLIQAEITYSSFYDYVISDSDYYADVYRVRYTHDKNGNAIEREEIYDEYNRDTYKIYYDKEDKITSCESEWGDIYVYEYSDDDVICIDSNEGEEITYFVDRKTRFKSPFVLIEELNAARDIERKATIFTSRKSGTAQIMPFEDIRVLYSGVLLPVIYSYEDSVVIYDEDGYPIQIEESNGSWIEYIFEDVV